MATRPSVFPLLDTNNTARTAPSGAHQDDGFVASVTVLTAQNLNYLHGYTGDWLQYMDQACALNADTGNNASARVLGMAWTGSGLNINMSAGVAIVEGDRTIVSATSHTFTDTATTYVGVDNAGTVSYSADQTLGDPPPSPSSGVVWFERIDASGGNAVPVSTTADRLDGALPIGVLPSRSQRIERDATGYDPRLELYSDESSGQVEIVMGVDEGTRCKLVVDETNTTIEAWDGTAKVGNAIQVANATGVVTAMGRLEAKSFTSATYNAGDTGASLAINFSTNGAVQRARLTGNAAFSFTFPGDGDYTLLLEQDGTGSRIPTFAGVTWAAGDSAVNSAAGSLSMVVLRRVYGTTIGTMHRLSDVAAGALRYKYTDEAAAASVGVTISNPPLVGSLLVAQVAARRGSTVTAITASGWTVATTAEILYSGEGIRSTILYRIADGGETSATFVSASATDMSAVVTEYSASTTPSLRLTGSDVTSATETTCVITGMATTTVHPQIAVAALGLTDLTSPTISATRTWSNGFNDGGTPLQGTEAKLAYSSRLISLAMDPNLTYTNTGNASIMALSLATFSV